MIVLAIYPSYILSNHDCNVAIAKDGELIYAYEEQKLSRVNHRESKYLPDRALLSALYTTQIDPTDIDIICLCGVHDVVDAERRRAGITGGVSLHGPGAGAEGWTLIEVLLGIAIEDRNGHAVAVDGDKVIVAPAHRTVIGPHELDVLVHLIAGEVGDR